MGNCPPGCFFLSDSGLCDIHTKSGYSAKPETCRLFPFNNFKRIGNWLIAAPHDSLCPLEVSDAATINVESDHEALLAAMRERGIFASVPVAQLPARDSLPAVVDLERSIVTCSESRLAEHDYLRFVDDQMRLEREYASIDTVGRSPHAVFDLICRLLGIAADELPAPDGQLSRVMTASTPFLRSNLIFRTAGSANDDTALDGSCVPYALTCIYVILLAAKSSGMRRVTFQTISRIEHDFRPLILLMANLDRVLTWRPAIPITAEGFEASESRERFWHLAKALLPSNQDKANLPLGILLEKFMPSNHLKRVLFIKRLAQHVHGKLVVMGSTNALQGNVPLRLRARSAVQRWALNYADPRTLDATLSGTSLRARN